MSKRIKRAIVVGLAAAALATGSMGAVAMGTMFHHGAKAAVVADGDMYHHG
jgi:hypothetical protein